MHDSINHDLMSAVALTFRAALPLRCLLSVRYICVHSVAHILCKGQMWDDKHYDVLSHQQHALSYTSMTLLTMHDALQSHWSRLHAVRVYCAVVYCSSFTLCTQLKGASHSQTIEVRTCAISPSLMSTSFKHFATCYSVQYTAVCSSIRVDSVSVTLRPRYKQGLSWWVHDRL